jgi:hypothetical protein
LFGHSLLEVYSNLTGMPGKLRVPPDEAMLFVANIRERLTILALTEEDYAKLLQLSATNRDAGGAIYDAALAHCAAKANAEVLYTWNLKDFRRLASPSLRVQPPSDLEPTS